MTLTLTTCSTGGLPQEISLTSACRVVLTRSNSLREIEASLRFIFKNSLDMDGIQATNFLLSRVAWFEQPYCQLLPILHKIIRWHRGKGRESATVCYNIVAEGMLTPSWLVASKTISILAESERDHSIMFTSLRDSYPYKNRSVETQENYLRGLLELIKRQSSLRREILSIIMEKLSSLDNQIRYANQQLECPYPDEEVLTEGRQHQDEISKKLDHLLSILLEHIDQQQEPQALLQDLIVIFNSQVLITDRLKSVQFVVYYACQKYRALACQFLQALDNNLHNSSLSKYAYLNNIYYLASYLVHSKQVTNNMTVQCISFVIESLMNELKGRPSIQTLSSINLRQHMQEHETLLQRIQMVVYVCTHRPKVYSKLQLQVDSLLTLAQSTCLFSTFVHPEIWSRFIQDREHQYREHVGSQNEFLRFSGKFNVVPLAKLGSRIDQIYRFSDLPPIQPRKRKASYILDSKPSKKAKLFEKQSQVSEESTTFYRGGETTPHRDV